MGFSINQVTQLYVANALVADTSAIKNLGDMSVVADANKTLAFFQTKTAGGLATTDKIDIDKILYVKATGSDKLADKLKRFEVKVDPEVSATPVKGQEYILRLAMRQYIGHSDENQDFRYGMTVATSKDTNSSLITKIAYSLAMNIKKDTVKPCNIYLVKAGVETPVVSTSSLDTLLALEATHMVLEEKEQDWVLGMMPTSVIPFQPQFVPITVDGDETLWGTAVQVTSVNSIPNGKKTADYEYEAMGARGDIYRGMGFPNIIKTDYLVDASKEYDYLNIHYYFVGANGEVQKSEKDLVIVAPNDGSHTVMNEIITEFNAKTGLKIAALQ